ncbi:nitrous oxidase accessory protein [Dyadobacter psychrophilus]|uniref:Nitrous oxidase accessory protein n=2 Tax=Dyadobacter psychrophilus TaxID=651661 RepID=A0A1T5B747_9BACT|nr:nitrous oxidase accessory protein [Dyadobacter psychrophilus]
MPKMLKIITLLACLWLLAATVMELSARTIRVGKTQSVTSIRQAIRVALAGDTILVDKGLYQEGNIIIDKPLVLKGIETPVLSGQKKYEIISVKSPHVVIEGFVIKASGQSSMQDIAGIRIYNTHHVSVTGNVLEDNFFGIYLQQSKHCLIKNNRLKAYGKAEHLIGNGIHSWKSDSLTIYGNHIQGHRDGMYLEFTTNSNVEHNTSHGNLRYGLHFMFAHHNNYTHNTFSSNGAGVAVMYTNHVNMKSNNFKDNWGDSAYGILLKEISDSHIEDNLFSGNTTAIFMEGASRIRINNNRFNANGWALKIQASCMDNRIERNNFRANTFDVATNSSLVLNNFDNNYWDKYEGYDLNKDGVGDVPYRPVSLFSMIVERYPPAMILFRSFMVSLLDRTEKMIPGMTPEQLKDTMPVMKPLNL